MKKTNEKGITLIALVITIIVLLILVGVTIATLTGENGILTKAIEAKNRTEIGRIEEEIDLAYLANLDKQGRLKADNFMEDVKEIKGVDSVEIVDKKIIIKYADLEKVFDVSGNVILGEETLEDIADSLIEQQQGENWVIAIDSFGKQVNMNLWRYRYLEDTNGWILNDAENAEDLATSTGYIESELVNGTIQGEIPAYIAKKENGVITEGFVHSMDGTFANLDGLRTLPVGLKFPDSVLSMTGLFYNCTNLESIPDIELPEKCLNMMCFFEGCTALTNIADSFQIPDSCVTILSMFKNCSNLTKLPEDLKLPSSVSNSLNELFYGCENLISIPEGFRIPENNNIEAVSAMFYGCTNLQELPNNYVIPESVVNVSYMFAGTRKLKGNIYIEGNPSEFRDMISYTSYDYENRQDVVNIYFSEKCTNIETILSGSYNMKIRGKVFITAKTVGDNMTLYGEIPVISPNNNNWVILVHGYNNTKENMNDLANSLYDGVNYNVLTPDLRGHGESNSKATTFGVLEGKDIVDWANYLKAINPNCNIVLYGFSMGGATVCMAAGENLPSNVSGIIEDSGYTSVSDIKLHIDSSSAVSTDFKNMFNNSLKLMQEQYSNYNELINVSFIDQVSKCKIPILFLHGSEDTLVPAQHAQNLYNAATSASIRNIYISQGCGHVEGISEDAAYAQGIVDVLNTLKK